MKQAFRECLKNRKIIPFSRAKSLVKKELATAEEDLAEAQDRFQNSRYKYATINAYYAIFHAARALLYSKGYRERSHQCFSIALEALFVEKGLMKKRFIRIFEDNMSLREQADYSSSFSRGSAFLSISNAEEFIMMVKTLFTR